MYRYAGKCHRVVDGGTIIAELDLGFGITKRVTLDILGVRLKDSPDSEAGRRATHFLATFIGNRPIEVRTIKPADGPYQAFISCRRGELNDKHDIAEHLVANGFAAYIVGSGFADYQRTS